MKYFIYIILIIFFSHCDKFNKPKDYSVISVDTLTTSRWKSDPYNGYGDSISFSKDGVYGISFSGEGCGQNWTGNYKIDSNNKVSLSEGIQQVKDCAPNMPKTTCEYKKEEEPLLYEYYLVCNSSKYWNANTTVPAGKELTFGGIPVITMGGKQAITIDDVKLRAKPDTNSESYKCSVEKYMMEGEKPFVPKDIELILLFRSKEKMKVKNWENYWYYAYVVTGWYGHCNSPSGEGWLYGEFIKEK